MVENLWQPLYSCIFSPVISPELVPIFTFLFLGVSTILLCTLFQGLDHMDMKWLHHESVFSYHHLHLGQSCWPFQWMHYVPNTWTFVGISLLFYCCSGTLCNPRILFEKLLWALYFLVTKTFIREVAVYLKSQGYIFIFHHPNYFFVFAY